MYAGLFYWNENRYQGKHEPIISKVLFDKVQAVREDRSKPKRKTWRFPFVGLLRCGYCGCAITAETKKELYTYYHCTGFRGECGQSWIREEDLAVRLRSLLLEIRIDDEKVEWIKEALELSHEEEKDYHDSIINKLQADYAMLQNRLDRMYLDRLDGKVTEQFWQVKSEEWRRQQDEILNKTQAHQMANRSYIDEGVRILELANKAYSLYLR